MSSLYNYFFPPPPQPLQVTEARKIYEQNVKDKYAKESLETSKNLNKCYQNIQKMIHKGDCDFTWCPNLTTIDKTKLEKQGYYIEDEEEDDSYYNKDIPGNFVYLYKPKNHE